MGPDIADVLTEMKYTKSREKCSFDEMCDHTLRDADIADVLTDMKYTKSREKCTFDEMCDHSLRDADTRRAGEISTPRQRRGIRTCCEPLSDDGRSPDTMRE